jgi:Tfp pilus assembly protein PilF
MRCVAFFVVCGVVLAQVPDPAYRPLTAAYEALRAHDYDAAIAGFLKALQADPQRAAARKDLAYTYLKTGANELARDQFREAMSADPADTQVAMEYAFLAYETNERQPARRIFDRVRKGGQAPFAATAEQAFRNIDAPLAAGIARWKTAIEMGADNFSAHFELATLAEQRDELELAAEHYEKAWRLQKDRRSVLVDLGRVWKALNRPEDAQAALLAASRGGEPRAAEMARELMPERYPFVPEFRRALELDPDNVALRRELGFLLLEMGQEEDAEREFQVLVRSVPADLLSATQLGFLLNARGETEAAQPLFDRVLAGPDEELANLVRAVLRVSQIAAAQESRPAAIDAKEMAARSIKAGYIQDALKYFLLAHESDPADFDVMLKLGWTYNMLHRDSEAIGWFDQARKSSNPKIAAEAGTAFRNLRASNARWHATVWLFPLFSSRWRDVFGYGQAKVELRNRLPIRPYVSLRFIGDTRESIGAVSPVYLSESAFIPGAGVRSLPWHHATAWAEAGLAVGYLSGHVLSDFRGGVSFSRGVGRLLGAESAGWFAETNQDAVFISRFGNDSIVYAQLRTGYTTGTDTNSRLWNWLSVPGLSRFPKPLQAQFYWNSDLTFDQKRQTWANFWELGPGLRLAGGPLPKSAYFTFNAMRGAYLTGGHATFNDLRVGLWYAFTR